MQFYGLTPDQRGLANTTNYVDPPTSPAPADTEEVAGPTPSGRSEIFRVIYRHSEGGALWRVDVVADTVDDAARSVAYGIGVGIHNVVGVMLMRTVE